MLLNYRKYVLALVAVIFTVVPAGAQTYNLINQDTIVINNPCSIGTGYIYDDGGLEGIYSDNFDGWLIINGDAGNSIRLTGVYNTESCCDRLSVWDGETLVYNELGGYGVVDITCLSGTLKLHFYTDGSVRYDGLDLQFSVGLGTVPAGVTNLTATNITSSSATLSWNSTSSGTFHVILDDEEAGVVTTTSYTLTGLSASSYHYVTVYATGMEENHCSYDTVTFRTACDVVQLPYREGFEGLVEGSFPPCWLSQINFDDIDAQPQVVGIQHRNGNNSLMLSSGSNATASHFGMVATPPLSVSGNSYVNASLLFTHSGTTVVIGSYSATGNDYIYNDFVPSDTLTSWNEGEWNEVRVPWSPSMNGRRLAFYMLQSSQNGVGHRVFIDDVGVVSCGVDSLAVQHVTENSMDVSWVVYGNPTCTVRVNRRGSFTVEQTITAATSPLTISGLQAGVEYTVSVSSDCGLARSINVITESPAPSADGFCSNFSYGGSLPAGWTFFVPHGNGGSFYRNGWYVRYDNSSSSGHAYMVCPRMDGLGGKNVAVQFGTGYLDDTVTLGVMTYADDTNTFVPIGSKRVGHYDSTLLFSIPAGVVGQYLALRFDMHDYWFNIDIKSVQIDDVVMGETHIAHRRATSLIVEWDTVYGSNVLMVEYGERGFVPGTGIVVQHTLAPGQKRLKITGLNPQWSYDVLVYPQGGTPCYDRRMETNTVMDDYEFPYCENFENLYDYDFDWSWYSWVRPRMFADYPRWDVFYADWNYYTSTLDMSSMGFEWDYYSTVILPDVNIDSVDVLTLSLYVTDDAPSSKIEVGLIPDRYYWREDMFTVIDSIVMHSPHERRHYAITLPVDAAMHSGRLCLRYRHDDQYHLYVCHIDHLALAAAAVGNLTVTDAGYTDVMLHLDTVLGADSVAVFLLKGNDTLEYHVAANAIDTMHFTGLDSGTYYMVYVKPLPDSVGCPTYAGHFFTQATGVGIRTCFTFENLLSYELPYGWLFGDSARVDDDRLVFDSTAVLPYVGDLSGQRVAVKMDPTDSLAVGYTVDSGASTVFVAALDGAHPAVIMPTVPDSARLVVYTPDTVHLRMIGVNMCHVVDFESVGGRLVCTVQSDYRGDYLVEVQEENSSAVAIYRVSDSVYAIDGLQLGHTYRVSYGCYSDWEICYPEVMVLIGDSLELPYCETFDIESGGTGVPESWTFYYDSDLSRQLEMGWGETPLRFGEWGRHNQKVVLPAISNADQLTVRVRAHIWNIDVFEIGTVNAMGDTSTFVPLVSNGNNTGWVNLVVAIDTLNGKRLAMRANDLVLIDRVNVSRAPDVTMHLIDSRTLRLDASSDADYWLHYYDYYGYDSVSHITTNPYYLQVAWDYINDVFLEVRPDSATNNCVEGQWYWLNDRMTLPLCPKDEYWDWEYRVIGDAWDDYYRDRRPHLMRSNSDLNNYAYRLLPEFEIDSVKRLTLTFDLSADYVGDMLEVGVMTDAYDTATFVPVDTVRYTLTSGWWQQFVVGFESYGGDGRWIAFRHRSGQCADCYGVIATCRYNVAPCVAATASVSLSRWNEAVVNAQDTGFYVEYGLESFTPGSGTMVYVDSLPYSITLLADATYDFYFLCNASDNYCYTPQRVTTLSQPLSVPVCIDFDTASAGSMLRNWTVYGNSVVTNSEAHSAPNSMAIGVGTTSFVVTPDIDIENLGGVSLSLWFRAEQQGDRLVVGTMSNPADMSTFYALRSFAPAEAGVWQHVDVSLANAPASHHFIALRARCNSNTIGARNIYVDDIHVATCAAFDLRVDNIDNNQLDLSWNEVGTPIITLTVDDDGNITNYSPSGGSFSLPVTTRHNYTITMHSQCSPALACAMSYDDTIHIVGPAESRGCVNPTDLYSPNSVFLSGSYHNPYANVGAIDYGSGSVDSRHTVCYDTTERDGRTGGLLRTIPEGATSSVRLGNWNTGVDGPEAEGVIYSMFVDTLSFNLLIMRYAVVLQDPLHAAEDQPRFRLELLDSAFNPIDTACASADFVANRNLGWNEAGDNVLWKDWTTFGVDMRNYADQNIYVRLTTYDCNEGSHYGYAYFTLECMRDNIVTETCGNVDSNTFSAPAGFNYRWYTLPSNTTVATTRRMVSGANNTTYYCDVSSTENPSCMFTISAYAGSRFPMALFDTMVTMHDCGFTVRFVNKSTISADGITPLSTGEPCEMATWDFGNGQTSNNYHGETFYNAPGTYTVTLVSGIAGGDCTDTAVFVMTLNFPTHAYVEGPDTLCYGVADSLRLYVGHTDVPAWQQSSGYQTLPLDVMSYAVGTNSYTVATVDPYGCSATISHTLVVNPSYRYTDTLIICTPMLPYSYADTVFGIGTQEVQYHQETRTIYGCDSSYHLWLTVSDTNSATIRDTLVASICDNEYFRFYGMDYNTEGTHVNVHLDNSGVCDSIHNLMLDVRSTSVRDTVANPCDEFTWYGTSYVVDTNAVRIDTNTVGCDSVTTLYLTLRRSTDTTVTHYIVENDLPYLFDGISFASDTSGCVIHHTNTVDCDSMLTFNLVVYPNRDTTIYRTVCEGVLPMQWNGLTFSIGEIDSLSVISHQALLNTVNGADSLVMMYLNVLRNSDTTFGDTIVQNSLAAFVPPLGLTAGYAQDEDDPTLVTLIDTTVVIVNAVGCDSIVHYSLRIYRNRHTFDTAQCCDNQLPYSYLDSALSPDGDSATYQFVLATYYGTDSVVSFTLAVHPTFELGDTHVICPHKPFLYEGVDYGGPMEFDSPHVTIHGCDSLVHVSLQPRDTLFRLAPVVSFDGRNWLPCDTTLLGCEIQHLWLDDTSRSVSREWTFWSVATPDSLYSDTLNGIDTLLAAGIYSYRLVATGEEGCVDTIERDSAVYVFHRPEADFRWEPFRVPNHEPQLELFTLTTPADSLYYSWLIATVAGSDQYDELDSARDGRWTYRWEDNIAEGEYDVALIAYWLHTVDTLSVVCTDTAWHPITIVNTYLQFPNLVTPNGDGVNDIWGVVNLLEYGEYSQNEVWIYDRAGSLIYHVQNINSESQFWDPNATNSPDGTYYYRFSGQSLYGVVKRNGIIEVLR